jgi:hypothetical protein
MQIDYNHRLNSHGLDGPRAAFPKLFPATPPATLLDVGCGLGTWLRAALDHGVPEVMGIDGGDIQGSDMLIPPTCFERHDLTQPVNLGRRFDHALCLEVAEHLEERYSDVLIDTLVVHSDTIVFGAACPGQQGQHHVNCQWPEWWQERFNKRGYHCDDEVRWRLWDEPQIEVWYRQNIFFARKDPLRAGREPRLKAAIHPDMLPFLLGPTSRETVLGAIAAGQMPVPWYATVALKGLASKAARRLARACKFGGGLS